LVEVEVGIDMMLAKLVAASHYLLAMLAVILSFRIIAGHDIKRRLALALVVVGGLAFAARVSTLKPGGDFRSYWKIGRYVLQGIDPYTATPPPGDMRLQYTPNSLSLFVPFGLLSERQAWAIFRTLNVLLAFAMVPLAGATLEVVGGRPFPGLSWSAVVVLSTTFFLSNAVYFCIGVGNLPMVVTVLILAALRAQAKGSPILAGIWLGLAAIKVHTAIPVLMLFHRRSDRPTWVSMAVVLGALGVLATPPTLLASRVRENLEILQSVRQPGAIDDYSFEGPANESIIGLDHLFYRLGTSIFLYHRTYDTVVLALPMLYAAGRARSESGRTRWWFAGCTASILLTLCIYVTPIKDLAKSSLDWPGAARIPIQAIVLPYATWLILAAMVLLVLGEKAANAPMRQGDGSRSERKTWT
jgi:hypothetical protein